MIKNKSNYITILIIMLIFLMRIPGINNPPAESVDMWRQADTESIARNFLNHEFNIFKPQFNYDGPLPNYIQLEFQITTFIIAILYRIFGEHYFLARLIPTAFFMISVYYLYKIAERIYGTKTAWLTIIVYGILPLNVFYSRAIMPESATLCFFNGAFYYFLTVMQSGLYNANPRTLVSHVHSVELTMAKRDWHSRGILGFILAGIFTALAISQKTPAIFIGLAFIFMCIDKYGLGFIKEIKLWIFAAIALIPPFAYILYSGRVAEFKFIEGIGSKHIIPKFMTAFFSPEAINFYKNNLSDSFTFIILILGAIGLCTLIHREDRPILYWAIAMVLEVIVIVSVIKFRYYLIFLTPIISILAGKVLYLFASRLKYIGTIGVFFILICIGYTSYSLVKDDFTVREDVVDFGRVIDEYTDEGDLIVIGYFDPTRISICNRQGWRAQKIEELQQYIDSGADYFILDENGIYNDDGSFRAYLDENFEMEVVEGKYRFYRLSSH